MKKILLMGALLFLISFHSSCDNEELTIISNSHSKKTRTILIDSENPFDELGEIHNVLFDLYSPPPNFQKDIEVIANEVNYLLSNYTNLQPSTITIDSLFVEWFEEIIYYPEQSLDTIISQSELSTLAETKLLNLIEITSGTTTTDINEALLEIISFEENIIMDIILLTKEKEIILMVSAIAKYSIYDNGDRKDKDWDLSVGNIVATINGAVNNNHNALLFALIAKIYLNNLRTSE